MLVLSTKKGLDRNKNPRRSGGGKGGKKGPSTMPSSFFPKVLAEISTSIRKRINLRGSKSYQKGEACYERTVALGFEIKKEEGKKAEAV